ncbi:MAG: hypothetical protein PUA82_02075 [Eubacteriales bacterium]|nr:hypothetical protein [Eubacteriales bacterium]
MGKLVKETGNRGYEPPVGVRKGCGLCPSGCRTVCIRGKIVDNDIVDGEMNGFALNPIKTDYGSFRKPQQK